MSCIEFRDGLNHGIRTFLSYSQNYSSRWWVMCVHVLFFPNLARRCIHFHTTLLLAVDWPISFFLPFHSAFIPYFFLLAFYLPSSFDTFHIPLAKMSFQHSVWTHHGPRFVYFVALGQSFAAPVPLAPARRGNKYKWHTGAGFQRLSTDQLEKRSRSLRANTTPIKGLNENDK